MYIPPYPPSSADYPASLLPSLVPIPGTGHFTAAAESLSFPFTHHLHTAVWAITPLRNALASVEDAISRFFPSPSRPSFHTTASNLLKKRDSSLQSTNVTIGVITGVLLAVFVIAMCYFCYKYRSTIRFTSRKKSRRHRKSGSSKSSKSSQTSSESNSPTAPSPAPAPPAPAAEG